MKAIVRTQYESLDVLHLKEVEKPAPNDDEILVKIHVASANPVDWHRMRGGLVRLMEGLRKPRDPRLGIDVAGRVEAVGNDVTQFYPGDEVFGTCAGGFAEYVSARENRYRARRENED